MEYQVRISGPGLEVDQTVSREAAFRLTQDVLDVANVAAEDRPFTEEDVVDRVRQIFERTPSVTNPAKIMAVVSAIRDILGRPALRGEITSFIARAGGDVPSNFARDLNTAVEKNWLEVGDGVGDEQEVTSKVLRHQSRGTRAGRRHRRGR